jgi:hypothetical protein
MPIHRQTYRFSLTSATVAAYHLVLCSPLVAADRNSFPGTDWTRAEFAYKGIGNAEFGTLLQLILDAEERSTS